MYVYVILIDFQAHRDAFIQNSVKKLFVDFFFPLQIATVAYFQREIQLSGFSAYPDGLPSLLIQISGILLYLKKKGGGHFRCHECHDCILVLWYGLYLASLVCRKV